MERNVEGKKLRSDFEVVLRLGVGLHSSFFSSAF